MKIAFAIYGIIVFSITLVLVFPIYYLIFTFAGASAPPIAHRFGRIWAKSLLIAFGTRLRVDGKEQIAPDKTYVFVANHLSLLDIPSFAVCCKNVFRFLAKEELTKVPVMGFVIKRLYISVNRSSKEDRQRSKDAMLQSIKEKISVFICPEGTRNKTAEPLLEFKDGAFLLAIEAQVPLAVLTIKNTNQLLPATGFFRLRPGRVYAKWETPIETKGMTIEDLPRLKSTVREMMLSFLNKKD